MPRASQEDPIKVFRFRVRVDGFVRAGFTKVTGFKRTTEQSKYREGGDNETFQVSAGLTSYGPITLTRGLIVGSSRGGDDDMYDWAEQVMSVAGGGNAANYRKDLDIEQYNAQNVRARVWTVVNSWPAEVEPTSDLDGSSSENAVESMVLAHEGWTKSL